MDNTLTKFDDLLQKASENLTEKWQDHFSPVSYSGIQFAQRNQHFVFKSEKYQKPVNVYVEKTEGKTIFRDDYATLAFNDEACVFLASIILEKLNGCSVQCNLYPNEKADYYKDFPSFLHATECGMDACCITKQPFDNAVINAVKEELKKSNIFGRFTFAQADENINIGKIQANQINTQNKDILHVETIRINRKQDAAKVPEGDTNGAE